MSNIQKKSNESKSDDNQSIQNVWKFNCTEEFARISDVIKRGYCNVAMDTEFPGFLFDKDNKIDNSEATYQTVKKNVDGLKPIQVGFSFSNYLGLKPEGTSTWQFNLCFDLKTENYSPKSIDLLNDAGIKFDYLFEFGIKHEIFSQHLKNSGLIFNQHIQWIVFHGYYDFAYLIKSLKQTDLPKTAFEFNDILKHLFPVIWDVKTIISCIEEWKNDSLTKLAFRLDLKRVGKNHQAGSDALLTFHAFHQIKRILYPLGYPDFFCNDLYGISSDARRIGLHNDYLAYLRSSVFENYGYYGNWNYDSFYVSNNQVYSIHYTGLQNHQNYKIQNNKTESNNFGGVNHANINGFGL